MKYAYIISSFLFLTKVIHSSTTSKMSLNGASIRKSRINIMKFRRARPPLKNFPKDNTGIKKKSIIGVRTPSFSDNLYSLTICLTLYEKKETRLTKNIKTAMLIILNSKKSNPSYIIDSVTIKVSE